MKVISLGAELFHADGQTVMIKVMVAFHNFAKAPKNLCRRTVGCNKLYES